MFFNSIFQREVFHSYEIPFISFFSGSFFLYCISKKYVPNQRSQRFSSMISYRSFIVLYFELIFVQNMRYESRFFFLYMVIQLFEHYLFKKTFFSFELPWTFYNYCNNFQIISFLCGDLSFYLVSYSFTLIISFNIPYNKCLLVMNFLSFYLSEKFFISLSFREVFLLHVELWVEICFLSALSLQSLLESLVCGGKPIIIIIFVPICNIY